MIYHTHKNEHSNNLTCSNCGFDIFSAQTNITSTIDLDYKDNNLIIRCAKCDQEHLILKPEKRLIKELHQVRTLSSDDEHHFKNYKQNYFAIPYFKVKKLGFISHFIHYVYFDIRKLSWRFKYTCDSNLYYVKYYYLKYLDREIKYGNLFDIDFIHIKRYYYLKSKTSLSIKNKKELSCLEKELEFLNLMKEQQDESYRIARIEWLTGHNNFFKSPVFNYMQGYSNPIEEDLLNLETRELNFIKSSSSRIVNEYQTRKDELKTKYLFELDQVIKWAEDGDLHSQLSLASMYDNKGIIDKKIYWYLRASKLDSLIAMEHILKDFFMGKSPQLEPNFIVDLCHKALSKDSTMAKEILEEGIYQKMGEVYLFHMDPPNYEQAIICYEKAYDHGLNKGEYHSIEYALGNAYVKQGQIHYAKKRKSDYLIAINYFNKSIELSSYEGQFMLSKCYYYGFGVNQDIRECINLLCGVADKYKDAYDFLKDIIKRNESHIIDQIKDYYHTNDLNEFLNNISFG